MGFLPERVKAYGSCQSHMKRRNRQRLLGVGAALDTLLAFTQAATKQAITTSSQRRTDGALGSRGVDVQHAAVKHSFF